MEEREKFLHDTIAAQRRFLAEQRAIAIRNRPPTRTKFRSQMMTYLKHVGNKKHSDLKNKTFEEIQALYEKDEKKRLKKKVAKETPKKEDTANTKHRPVDSEIMERKYSLLRFLNKYHHQMETILLFTEPMGTSGHSTISMRVLHIFDRQDLFHMYDLVKRQVERASTSCQLKDLIRIYQQHRLMKSDDVNGDEKGWKDLFSLGLTESAKTVAPTPNSAIVQIDVDDNFVINNRHIKIDLRKYIRMISAGRSA
ncbi:hypothetical protein Tco_0657468 [Tanacetum coccineum]|uniref:Uncharacterized protein n=1 Tax=Tanacetum coccineum TaxID=301880 RepID=A0ABQ4XBV5_9ASTR